MQITERMPRPSPSVARIASDVKLHHIHFGPGIEGIGSHAPVPFERKGCQAVQRPRRQRKCAIMKPARDCRAVIGIGGAQLASPGNVVAKMTARERSERMSDDAPTLHLLCGKIAAGKSTHAKHLASAPATVLISEDRWISHLYQGDIASFDDYLRCSARLRDLMSEHAEALLLAGVSVVLDFAANTVASRQWMRGIIERSGARHQLHFFDIPDAVCKARLKQRNAAGAHEFAATEADFDVITAYFVPPGPDEDFNVIHYTE